jgi:phosphoglycerate dehydrogenase-like enzyme
MIRVAIAPSPAADETTRTVEASGGVVNPLGQAEVLVWQPNSADGLQQALSAGPGLKWAQLTSAGVDWLLESSVVHPSVVRTCAKGSGLGENAAELAMLMMLSAVREFHTFVHARSWTREAGRRFAGSRVGIFGGGGIGRALAKRLAPFEAEVTVVKRTPSVIDGAMRVLGPGSVDEVIARSDFFVLAAPLTEETRGCVDRRRLALFSPSSWVVNVARGRLVDTEALVDALREKRIGGAALDVVDPEPLPEGHPLWDMANVILTPHVASTRAIAPQAVANVLSRNLVRWANGEPLVGVVDRELGY